MSNIVISHWLSLNRQWRNFVRQACMFASGHSPVHLPNSQLETYINHMDRQAVR